MYPRVVVAVYLETGVEQFLQRLGPRDGVDELDTLIKLHPFTLEPGNLDGLDGLLLGDEDDLGVVEY